MPFFLLRFLLLLALLFGLELLAPVQRLLIGPWTEWLATASGALLAFFDADVLAHANVIQSRASGFGVAILPGCNGVEACLVLLAAVLAFPAGWRAKATVIALGLPAVQLANLLRIVSLFYLGQWDMAWFEFAHLYVWQALIMLDVLAVWLLWMRHLARRGLFLPGATHAR